MTRERPHLQVEVQGHTMGMTLPGWVWASLRSQAGRCAVALRGLQDWVLPVLLQNPCVLAQTVPGHQADGSGLLGISWLGV